MLWSYILIFYIQRFRRRRVENRLYFILIAVLAIDALRTMFESVYFGAWYTSLAGLIPIEIHNFLIRPEMVVIPKMVNVIAATFVIFLILRRWLPEEEKLRQDEEKKVRELKETIQKRIEAETKLKELNDSLEDRIKERSQELAQTVDRLQTLREIDQSITGGLDLHLTLGIVLKKVSERIGFDASLMFLADASRNFKYFNSRGFRSEQAIKEVEFQDGEGFFGQAALEKKLTMCNLLDESKIGTGYMKKLAAEDFVTCYALPLISKGEVLGVLVVFHRSLLDIEPGYMGFLEILAGQAAIAIDNTTLFENLRQTKTEIESAYHATLEGWVNTLDLRDEETQGHTRRVTDLTMEVAREMGMSEDELVHVYRGALLHDIGKMAVPDSILKKEGPLNDEELEIMKLHPVTAYKLLSPISYLKPVLDIPYHHHERWDGTGYPLGLVGKEIPLAARCFAIVDVWDALRSSRPYRDAWSDELTLEYIVKASGKHFDPEVVEAFVKILKMEELKSFHEKN